MSLFFRKGIVVMRVRWCRCLLLAILCGVFTNSVFAQEIAQTGKSASEEVEALKQQLRQMEYSVARQQEQIKELKEKLENIGTGATVVSEKNVKKAVEEYLSLPEARKESGIEPVGTGTAVVSQEYIKKAVEDYLSTPEARKEMGFGLSNVTAEYTPDDEKYALSFKSSDGNFSLNTGGRMQFRYTYKDKDADFNESDTQDITIRRARVYMGGNIYSKFVHYYVEADFDNFNLGMRDFYVYWDPIHELNAKIGYFKVPFNRQRVSASSRLLLQDRSIASEEFDQDRDYGVDIYGNPFGGYMEYHAAVFQGAGEKSIKGNTDNELLYVLNARYNPFGKYDYYDETDVKYTDTLKATIGASVAFNGKDSDEKLEKTNTVVGVVDLGVKYKGLAWNNEYFVRTEDPESDGDTINSDGFYTQLGYFVLPKKLEMAARYSQLDPNNDVSKDFQKEYTIGVNYYFRAHRSKIQTDFGHYVTDDNEADKEDSMIRVQYQIIF